MSDHKPVMAILEDFRETWCTPNIIKQKVTKIKTKNRDKKACKKEWEKY